MRTKIYIVFAVLICAVMAFSVYKKEALLKSDDVFYLALAPVDPRSLMQGDYMILDYDINSSVRYGGEGKSKKVILSKDGRGIASFVGFDEGQKLKENEFKVNLIKLNAVNFSASWAPTGWSVAPVSYMFQEGHAQRYESAAYGVLKAGKGGEVLLTGLAASDLEIIK